jgi:hypothetical protein
MLSRFVHFGLLSTTTFAFSSMLLFTPQVAVQASACEMWKSEIASTSKEIGLYIYRYKLFHNNEISRESFITASDKYISRLESIKAYAQSEPSCKGLKNYERRRQILSFALNISLPVMYAREELDKSLMEELKNASKN